MSFRAALLVSMILLVVGVAAATAVAVGTVVERSAREAVAEDLARSHGVVTSAWSSAHALEGAQSRVLAEEPRLKAVVATVDIGHATIVGVAQEINRGLHADVLLIGDEDGFLLADVEHPDEEGDDLKSLPMVRTALAQGDAPGIVEDDAGVYRAHAQRLALGETVVGVLVLGYRVDDSLARAIESQTGLTLVVLAGDRPISSSSSALAAEVASVGSRLDRTPREVAIGGTHYLAVSATLEEREGAEPLRYVLMASLDRALAPSRQLARLLYVVSAIALVLGIAVALMLSGALSRPLGRMAEFARRIAAGELDARAQTGGLRELRTLGSALDRMGVALRASRDAMAAKQRMEKELEIASRLQTSLLPAAPRAPGLEIAARMTTASEVGGDYYDVLPGDDVSWLAIGDVAGHGLPAGIVMLMVRTALAALVQSDPRMRASELVVRLNRSVHEGVRERLGTHEHVTFCALRHEGGGRFQHAGAHEDILVWRKATKKCERIATRGTWLGVSESVERLTVDSDLALEIGDVMVLMTDGAFEGERPDGSILGVDALVEAIESFDAIGSAPAQAVLDHLDRMVAEAVPDRRDDVTLMVVKRGA